LVPSPFGRRAPQDIDAFVTALRSTVDMFAAIQ
jgi:hypothetical protein